MIKPLLTLILITSYYFSGAQNEIKAKRLITENYGVSRDTTYRIIGAAKNTFGYEILIKNKSFIKQTSIPALPGLTGFKRKGDADKVARLVIQKLNKGIMPPTIEKYEMDKMHILY